MFSKKQFNVAKLGYWISYHGMRVVTMLRIEALDNLGLC